MKSPTGLTHATACPACGAEKSLPILYGLYRSDAREALEARYPDGYRLGGCVFSPGGPNRVCRQCGLRYRYERPPERRTDDRSAS